MDAKDDELWEYELNIKSSDRVSDLLDGRQHTDDNTRAQRRQFRRETNLPCHKLLRMVADRGLQRPDRSTFKRL